MPINEVGSKTRDWIMQNTVSRMYHLRSLRLNQFKSSKELTAIQLKKLKVMIKYVYDYIPYYHQLFKTSNFKPEDLKDIQDLTRIPVTTKKDLQNNYSDFFPNGFKESMHRVFHTSGTTGIPLTIIIDRKGHNYQRALAQYAFAECGLGPNDKLADIARYNPRQPEYLIRDLIYWFNRKKFIPLTDRLENIISTLRKLKPDAIYTWPSMLASLANCDVSGINPRLIFTQSENLPQYYRSMVRRAFGVEINDTYGSQEFRRLAFECNDHCGLHIITDCAVLEFLDDGEEVFSGELGQIIVTCLYNYAMPLIRYELGDVGIPTDEHCTCGRGWPLIKSIQGRNDEYIVFSDGRRENWLGLYHCIRQEIDKHPFCCSQFQVIQEKIDRFLLKFVRGKEFEARVIAKIKENAERYFAQLGYEMAINVRIEEDIPMERTGKRRTMIPLGT